MNINPNENESKSQNRLLLAHLRTGASITGIEALSLYGRSPPQAGFATSAKWATISCLSS